jgi:hypothetical protein
MARQFAQLSVNIWSDEHFKSMRPEDQHMYFVLLSQPRVSLCGVIDYIPSRIARCSYHWTVSDVEDRIKALIEQRYVVLDEETSEVLIRSFVRNDGLLKVPNIAKGMASEYGEVMSQRLRDVIVKELKRAHRQWPDLGAWRAIRDANPVLADKVLGGVRDED